MARHQFGQSLTDWTFSIGVGSEAILTGPAEITMWSDWSGGTQYTDLLDENGLPITSVTSADGSGGLPIGTIPRFDGPDGVTFMWADTGTGTRYVMVATDVGATVTSNEDRLDNVENAVAALQALAAVSVVTVIYDEVGAVWPTRPDIAGSRVVFWLGPVGSPPPVGYMLQNDQFFGWQA